MRRIRQRREPTRASGALMLVELAVRDLGVIEELSLVLGAGMTAVTGETGAGKTLVVDAIELLVGGRADGGSVRHGASEAVVEGRFLDGEEEVVVRRVVQREGRSRAYVDGRLATVGELAERGRDLVDLHGQHAHQSLLAAAAQRAALDRYAAIDLAPLHHCRVELAELEAALEGLGGDDRARARQLDLLRFQVEELDAARIEGPDEDERLEQEEDRLADAVGHQEGGLEASEAIGGEDGALDQIAAALAAVEDRSPYGAIADRLRSVSAELSDISGELRALREAIEDDPERLAAVRERRALLHDLRRKYGETLAEVIAYRAQVGSEVEAIEGRDARALQLQAEIVAARAALAAASHEVGEARRRAAPGLAEAVTANLAELAMPRARLTIDVGHEDPGDDVVFGLAANPGSPPAPLAKVASGGELARAMLALRLVLTTAPGTLVFDEVDAGIGGTAAISVGTALARLGSDHQVLVVTHLAQVAAAADHQVVVAKDVTRNRTLTSVGVVSGDERVAELARMLSGTPGSPAALQHAAELLGA